MTALWDTEENHEFEYDLMDFIEHQLFVKRFCERTVLRHTIAEFGNHPIWSARSIQDTDITERIELASKDAPGVEDEFSDDFFGNWRYWFIDGYYQNDVTGERIYLSEVTWPKGRKR